MIDEDYRVWLIEVNENPYLGVPNDFIKYRKIWTTKNLF